MQILVTGGAGYIGSITVERLLADGHGVTVLDVLATGHAPSVPPGARMVRGTLHDRELVAGILRDDSVEAVVHCAARAQVGESVADPALYYRENVVGGIALLDALREANVGQVVFSSTAAVYG